MTELLSPTAPAVEMLVLDEIHAFDGNSKAHPPDQVAALARSIREFGFTAPVLIDETGTLLAGHGRVLAAREVGLLSVPAIRVTHLTADQKRAYVIADNRLTELGGWDERALAEQIQMLMDAGVDVSVTGFDDKDSKRLLAALTASAGNTDPDAAPPLQKKAISRRGDVWTLGRHRVMCGDSTTTDDVTVLMGGGMANMVFTDPPYGVDYQSNWRVKSKKFDALANDDKFLDFTPIVDTFSNGWLFVWTSWKVQTEWIRLFCGFGYPTNIVVWHKPGGGIGDLKRTFSSDYELALVWNRGAALCGKRIGSVWAIAKDGAPTYRHPTQKPVALADEALDKCTRSGDIVLDLFGGSGTTLISAEKNGRDARLMELDPRYCDVIVRRWQEFTGLKAVHAGDGVEFDEIATLR